MYRKLLSLLCFIMLVGAVSGCNTVKGVGEDVQASGKAVSNAAS